MIDKKGRQKCSTKRSTIKPPKKVDKNDRQKRSTVSESTEAATMTNEARPSSPGFTGNQLNLPSQEYSEVDRPHSQGKIYTQGTLTKGDRRLSTVNLLIK